MKFTYIVKNRKLMTDLQSHLNVQRDQSLHGFAQSSEFQIDDNQLQDIVHLPKISKTIKGSNLFTALYFLLLWKLKIYIIICRASSNGPSHSEKIKLHSQDFLIISDRTLTYFFYQTSNNNLTCMFSNEKLQNDQNEDC